MAKAPTRAHYFGVKPKALLSASQKKIAKARALLAEVSAAWDENYQPVAFDIEGIVERIDALGPVIDEGVEYLNEVPEGDA